MKNATLTIKPLKEANQFHKLFSMRLLHCNPTWSSSMKKIFLLAIIAVFGVTLTAIAGEYHFKSSLSCYQCHTMHYSQQHPYGYQHEGDPYFGQNGPYNALLRDEVNSLCLSCHDAEDVIDVYQASTPYLSTNRQAGFLNRVGDANVNSGHTLGATSTAPGGTWSPDSTLGLECTNCHNPHGGIQSSSTTVPNPDQLKGTYRNLTYRPGTLSNVYVTYNKPSDAVYPDPTNRDVQLRANSPFVPNLSYETGSTDFYEPVADSSRYGRWCQGCHTDFHGNEASPNMANADGWLRHPSAQANLSSSRMKARFQTRHYRPQVMSPTGNWGTQGDSTWVAPSDLTPSCFSCHKGHGNNNAFGLIYMTGDQPRSENGDATSEPATCKTCHTQGT
jgi:hypothetical protein